MTISAEAARSSLWTTLSLSRRDFLAGLGGACLAMSAWQAQATPTWSFPMRIRFSFAGHVFTATLSDSPTGRDLVSLLPLDVEIEDYSTNEKIFYPPRKLATGDDTPFGNEAPGDLCYYAPWGDVVLFHAGYRYSRGLHRIGRLDGPVTPLLTRGTHPLRVETLT